MIFVTTAFRRSETPGWQEKHTTPPLPRQIPAHSVAVSRANHHHHQRGNKALNSDGDNGNAGMVAFSGKV